MVVAGACLLSPTARLAAQDPFEIVVYPAATASRGEWELETHLNYTARGTTAFSGSVAPTQRQTHLTFELTHGITADWEASAYVLTAYRPGVGSEYAGWRLRSRVHAPARWKLPLDLGFSAELEAPRPAYGGASPTVELTPILEKRFGNFRLGLNANFERDLGEGEAGATEKGWEFEPSALLAYRVSSLVTAKLEYHGAFGELAAPLAGSSQIHQLFPGVDLRLGDTITLGLSVGVGTTAVGNRLVFASRFEVEF
ncbi:MAG TPA: hypothetical protein VN953_00905 [Gemmatimonadales bacterium]|nr:hypothetical protein [Gemmatimonadales bacterium]